MKKKQNIFNFLYKKRKQVQFKYKRGIFQTWTSKQKGPYMGDKTDTNRGGDMKHLVSPSHIVGLRRAQTHTALSGSPHQATAWQPERQQRSKTPPITRKMTPKSYPARNMDTPVTAKSHLGGGGSKYYIY